MREKLLESWDMGLVKRHHLHELVDFVSIELERLQMAQDQRRNENFLFRYVSAVLVVAVLSHGQVARRSQALEQKDRHESAIEKVLVLAQVRQGGQLVHPLVIHHCVASVIQPRDLVRVFLQLFQFASFL